MDEVKPVGIGVVGCGVIGTSHLKSLRRSSRAVPVAVADVRADVARAAGREFGVEAVYDDAHAMFADERVEGVVLALPACWRFELAVSAFGRGRHVLIEKPVGMDAGEVERLIRARGDLVAGCCSARHRLLPSAAAAAEVVASGALGPLRVVRCRGLRPARGAPAVMPPPWRLSRAMNGGGILANWGCYDLDYLLGITGWSLVPESVFAQTWPIADVLATHVPAGSDAETHALALIRCAGGAMLSLERGEYVAAAGDLAWQLVGEHGSLALQMTPGRGKRVELDEITDAGVSRRTVWQGDETGEEIGPDLIDDFAAAIRREREPATSLERALTVQRITDAIYTSARTGTAVSFDERQS